jgi:hypothetical protein
VDPSVPDVYAFLAKGLRASSRLSYYGIFNGCVDLGNYETRKSYFPVRFRSDIGSLPNEAQHAYGVQKNDFYTLSRR